MIHTALISLAFASMIPLASANVSIADESAKHPHRASKSDAVRCQGTIQLPSQFISLNCFLGSCSATLPGSVISASGNCSDGITFHASVFDAGTMVRGQCNSGMFRGYVPSETFTLDGTCSNGGRFRSAVTTRAEFLSGACHPDRFSHIFVSGGTLLVDGACSTD